MPATTQNPPGYNATGEIELPHSGLMAQLAGGGFVQVYEQQNSQGTPDLFAQRFDANANPIGSPIFVAHDANGMGAGLPGGGFVVVAMESGGFRGHLHGLVFDANGQLVRDTVIVGSDDSSVPEGVNSVAALSDGSYVVAFSYGVNVPEKAYYIQVAADGSVGPTTALDSSTTTQTEAHVTALGNGNFVATWVGSNSDPSGDDVYAALITPQGKTVSVVNTQTADGQHNVYTAALADGGYVVVWQTPDSPGRRDADIHLQRYDAAGHRVGGETLVNTITAGDQNDPSVVGLSGGGYVVAWAEDEPSGGATVHYQIYDASGGRVGGEAQANLTNNHQVLTDATNGPGFAAEMTATANNGFDINWGRLFANDTWGTAERVFTTGGPDGSGPGQALTASGTSQYLLGGAGDDTLTTANGGETVVTEGGHDVVAFAALAQTASTVLDFNPAIQKLDFTALLHASGYTGSDPIGDGYVKLIADGKGDTWVYFDTDGHGTADQFGTFMTTLDGVSPSQISDATLVGFGAASPPPPPVSPPPTSPPPVSPPPAGGGTTLHGASGGSDLVGTSGDDTLIGGSGPDTMTGEAGDDHFAWNTRPLQGGEITDFTHGQDKLDLTGLLSAYGYHGTDPIADGYVKLIDDGQGDTWVYFDSDGHGTADQWGTFVTKIDNVAASSITDADLVGFGTASPPPPASPPPVSPPPASGGVTLHGQSGGSNLVGTAGDDTLIGGSGPDTMTGEGGADHFTFQTRPLQGGEITDFTEGVDKIDLSALLAAYHYAGTDPIADGYVKLIDDSHGDTWLYFDSDGPGTADQWGTFVTKIDNVAASSLTGSDFIFR